MKMLAPALLSLALAACASNTAPEGSGHVAGTSAANTALRLVAYHWRLSSAKYSSAACWIMRSRAMPISASAPLPWPRSAG